MGKLTKFDPLMRHIFIWFKFSLNDLIAIVIENEAAVNFQYLCSALYDTNSAFMTQKVETRPAGPDQVIEIKRRGQSHFADSSHETKGDSVPTKQAP